MAEDALRVDEVLRDEAELLDEERREALKTEPIKLEIEFSRPCLGRVGMMDWGDLNEVDKVEDSKDDAVLLLACWRSRSMRWAASFALSSALRRPLSRT